MKDIDYLLTALNLAQERKGFCAPNPSVGAVIVQDDKIVGQGYHYAAGYPHAEVMACDQAGELTKGATLYVTLEPCCHHGRTPPCTDLIIKKGIKHVVYGYGDPNPVVAGKGEKLLRDAGIICEQETNPAIDDFYASYHYWHKTQRPFVSAKIAMSLDAKIAAKGYKPVLITGKALQQFTHQQRKAVDAILTTVNTIKADDPQLNVRLTSGECKKNLYILDRHLNFPPSAQVLKTAEKIILFCSMSADKERRKVLEAMGIECVPIKEDNNGYLNWDVILDFIGKVGCHDLWVEAGGRCFTSLAKQQLINRALVYIAPLCLGSEAIAAFDVQQDIFSNFQNKVWRQVGRDVVLELVR